MRITIERTFCLDFSEISHLLLEELGREDSDTNRVYLIGSLLEQLKHPESARGVFEEHVGLTISDELLCELYADYEKNRMPDEDD